MIKPESAFINTIHKKLKQVKPEILIRKISDRFNQGWPDVLYISPFNYKLWIEYKVYPNKLSNMQEHTIIKLVSYNEHVAVITKHYNQLLNETNYYIKDYLNNPNNTLKTDNPATWILTKLGFTCESSTP